jgi:ferritin-like metal-binding protein YciE
MRKEITEGQITELMQAIPRAEEVDRLRAEIERLRAEVQRQTRHVEQLYDQIRRRADERDKAQIEVKRLRADNERLRKVYVLIATESAGIVEGGSIFEDKIAGCYASHQSADKAGENLGYVNWRIEEHTIISKELEGKP